MCKREILGLIVSAVILFQIQKSDLVVFWGVMKGKVRISDKQRDSRKVRTGQSAQIWFSEDDTSPSCGKHYVGAILSYRAHTPT